MANKLTSTLIRVTNLPDDYDYEACINAPPRTRQVNYRLRFDGPGEMRIRKVKLVGSGAAYFTYAGPETVARRGPGPLLNFAITFKPEKARRYRARLKIHYILYRPDGSILSIWDSVLLTGVGKRCALPAPPPGGGVALPGGNGDPNAGGDTPPGGDTAGEDGGSQGDSGSEDGASPDDDDSSDSAGESSGGSAPGGSQDNSQLPELTVCLRFRKLRGAWEELDNNKLDEMLEKVNRIWRRAGIRFTRADRPLELVQGPPVDLERIRADPHCLDVFIGGSSLVAGTGLGQAHVDGGLPGNVEVHRRFRQKGGYCSTGGYIELEFDAAPSASEDGNATADNAPHQVLAHELGHALGLGPEPDPTADEAKHLDPTTGEPITNEERLMYPASGGGTGLTDHEVRVARKLQELVKGGQPRYSGCTKTSRTVFEPEGKRSALALGAGLRSFPDQLTAYLRIGTEFPIVPGLRLGIDLDLDGTGEAHWNAEYLLDARGWRISAPAVDSDAQIEMPALGAPRPLLTRDGAPSCCADSARGFAVDIPKARIARYEGIIGWRVWGDFGEPGRFALPLQDLETLDITTPQMYLELAGEPEVHAGRAGRLILQGTVSYSSTFTGSPELALRLAGSSAVLARVHLEAGTREWELTAELPDLEAGSYSAWVDARCDDCGTQTSLPFTLRIESCSRK